MTIAIGKYQHNELARMLGALLSETERHKPRTSGGESGPEDSQELESRFFCKDIPALPNVETRRQSACCEYPLMRPPPDCVESGSTICSSQLTS